MRLECQFFHAYQLCKLGQATYPLRFFILKILQLSYRVDVKVKSWSFPVAQQVKDPALSLQGLRSLPWHEFNPSPGNFHMPQARPKRKKKKVSKIPSLQKYAITFLLKKNLKCTNRFFCQYLQWTLIYTAQIPLQGGRIYSPSAGSAADGKLFVFSNSKGGLPWLIRASSHNIHSPPHSELPLDCPSY